MIITENTLSKVYRCKLASIETMESLGYTLIQELFCDSSGLGADNEPALTKSQFEIKLTELLKEHGSLTAKITMTGQFQVYIGLFKKDKERQKTARKIKNNTYRIELINGYKIRFHDTDIITYTNDGYYTLNNGGFFTNTTKKRLNEFLPSNYYVYQKDFNWYIKNTDTNEDIPFKNQTTLKA